MCPLVCDEMCLFHFKVKELFIPIASHTSINWVKQAISTDAQLLCGCYGCAIVMSSKISEIHRSVFDNNVNYKPARFMQRNIFVQ